MSAALQTIAGILNLIPEARWDRYVVNDETCEVYGQFEVDDFILLRFQGLDDATLAGWVCSSAKAIPELTERLGMEQGLVQSVADVFGPAVPSVVR